MVAADQTLGLEEMVGRLDALVGLPQVAEEYIRFRVDLLKAQWVVRQALHGSSASEPASRASAAESIPAKPLLGPDTVLFDPGLLHGLFSTLRDSAAARGHQTDDLRRLSAAVDRDPTLLQALAGMAAFGPDMEGLDRQARELRVLVDMLLFVGRAVAAPFVAEAARRVAATRSAGSTPEETAGHCRICGSLPSFARLRREDGRRILYCGLCGDSWEFTRLACPSCGSADREAFSLLRQSEEEPRWIEACERCMGYIKTVDERKLPVGETIIPVVEESGTLHLDLLAEREGYIRRIPYVLSG